MPANIVLSKFLWEIHLHSLFFIPEEELEHNVRSHLKTIQNNSAKDGDIRRLFDENDNDIEQIKRYVQLENKKAFPYLSGVKICNYWLYVIHQYTDRKFQNLDALTVAPDTHVCKASLQLGLITEEEYNSPNVQQIVIETWRELFKGTEYKPIDIHTPLWLWSRNGFREVF